MDDDDDEFWIMDMDDDEKEEFWIWMIEEFWIWMMMIKRRNSG